MGGGGRAAEATPTFLSELPRYNLQSSVNLCLSPSLQQDLGNPTLPTRGHAVQDSEREGKLAKISLHRWLRASAEARRPPLNCNNSRVQYCSAAVGSRGLSLSSEQEQNITVFVQRAPAS